MRISKARYMQMLSLNSLYLVNYLNYLSYKAQTRAQVLTEGMTTSVGKYLKSLIIGLGERQALYTCFETNLKALSELTRQSPSVCETQLIEASAQKLLTVDASQASLRIFMRR